MGTPANAFADNFMRGFGMMDAYYDRKDNRKRRDRAETRAIESNALGMENTRLNISNNKLQNKKLKREDYARQYSNIVSNDDGTPLDFKAITPEQLQQKKPQMINFLNGYDPILDAAKKANPNVVGFDDIQFVYDNKTKKTMVSASLKMKDGSSKPMTWGRSSDSNDPVKMISLADMNNGIMGYLGQDMGAKPTMKEARLSKEAELASTEEFRQKKILANIRAGNSGTGGGQSSKQVIKLKEKVRKLNQIALSTMADGMSSFEGNAAEKFGWTNELGERLVDMGQTKNSGTISRQVLSMVNDIYDNDGYIKEINGDIMAFTGKKDEAGNPEIKYLFRGNNSGKKTGGKSKPVKKSSKKTPTWAEFLPAVKALPKNKGMSDKQIRDEYNKRYRADKAESDKKITVTTSGGKASVGLADTGKTGSVKKSTYNPVKKGYDENIKPKIDAVKKYTASNKEKESNRVKSQAEIYKRIGTENPPSKAELQEIIENDSRFFYIKDDQTDAIKKELKRLGGDISDEEMKSYREAKKKNKSSGLADAKPKNKKLSRAEIKSNPRLKALRKKLNYNSDNLSHQEKVRILTEIQDIENGEGNS